MANIRACAVMADNVIIRHFVELWKAFSNKEPVDLLEGVGAGERLSLGCQLGAGTTRLTRDDQSTHASLSGRSMGHHSQVRACSCRRNTHRRYCRLRPRIRLRTSQGLLLLLLLCCRPRERDRGSQWFGSDRAPLWCHRRTKMGLMVSLRRAWSFPKTEDRRQDRTKRRRDRSLSLEATGNRRRRHRVHDIFFFLLLDGRRNILLLLLLLLSIMLPQLKLVGLVLWQRIAKLRRTLMRTLAILLVEGTLIGALLRARILGPH